MNFKNLLYLATAFVLTSCNQAATNSENTKDSLSTVDSKTSVDIQDAGTKAVYEDYIALKDALVKSDSATAKTASGKLSAAMKQVDGCEPTAKIADSLSNAGSLEAQRKHFTLLSSELIPLIKHTSIKSGNIFVQFCPMANSAKGAYWLASEKEIRNPYYGDEMLECGEVKEEIKAQ